MVMKVGNINPILFRASNVVSKPENTETKYPQVKELENVTPDFAVKTPQKYQKLGIEEAFNGLQIHKYKLANGYKVTIVPMEGSPATVKNYVNVGSMNETDDIKGISHFLEHMAFNGTNGDNGYLKLDPEDSFKKIDELGGWTNASTNYAITDYVNSTPLLDDLDLEKQIEIIAAMTENLKLSEDMIEKEKGPVCSEINMILDRPQTIALDQTLRTLFNIRSSADELVAGSVKHIKNLTRDDVKKYYDKYYTPDNMNLVITGDVDPDEVIKLVSKNFRSTKKAQSNKYSEKLTPINKTVRKDFISDKATSAQLVIGFSGPKNNDVKGQVLYEVASRYLNSSSVGLSEKLKDYNTSGGFEAEKFIADSNSPMMLIYGTSASEDNIENVLRAVYDKFLEAKAPSEEELKSIKEAILRENNDVFEFSSVVNDIIGRSVLLGDLTYITDYEKILNEITPEDIEGFINDYFNLNKAAITVVHPQVSSEEIYNNYQKANLSFKGRTRKPVNEDKIKVQTLDNNVNVGFYKSKNENLSFKVCMKYEHPKNTNPALVCVYDAILGMGTKNCTREEAEAFSEKNNIVTVADLSKDDITIASQSSAEKFDLAYQKVWEYIMEPRLDEETFAKAVARVQDRLSRSKETSSSLLQDVKAEQNPYFTSNKDIEKGLQTLTLNDIKAYHNQIIKTAQAFIVMNVPENNEELMNDALMKFSQIPTVRPNNNSKKDLYYQNTSAIVRTKAREVSQADIMQTYTYKSEGSVDELVKEKLINIMMNSSSIGLFNNLREKEQLAYLVNSSIKHSGNLSECSFKILTTTDNKEIGEVSYDNLQKSINGFHRQLNCLLNSEYTDKDFENAKKMLKASLLNQEGTLYKLDQLNYGMNSTYGVNFENKAFEIIDSITREDIDKFAKKMFANPPIYTIVATEDTLNANKEYLLSLKA